MVNKKPDILPLINAVVNGDNTLSVELSEQLVKNGLPVDLLIHDGLTAALRSLDVKCTNEEFNLLEIMLAGRAMMSVMDKVVAKYVPSLGQDAASPGQTIILGTIRGDIHELGKHVVKMLLKANGFRVVDIGRDVPPAHFVKAAIREGAAYIGVSSLITLTIPSIREIKRILAAEGAPNITVLAGGAAIQQANPSDLNVDFVAKNAFDALHFLNGGLHFVENSSRVVDHDFL